jgi:hypothetical protein
MSLGTAFRAFFAALTNRETSRAIELVLEDPGRIGLPAPAEPSEKAPRSAPPARSDAVALLALLQREARLVDLVQEPLDQFSDAQVGAAARPCLKQCQQSLERVFQLKPLVASEEGARVEIPADASPLRYQWVGESAAQNAGQLVHHGWVAEKCELPQWTGTAEDSRVVAPAQLQ